MGPKFAKTCLPYGTGGYKLSAEQFITQTFWGPRMARPKALDHPWWGGLPRDSNPATFGSWPLEVMTFLHSQENLGLVTPEGPKVAEGPAKTGEVPPPTPKPTPP